MGLWRIISEKRKKAEVKTSIVEIFETLKNVDFNNNTAYVEKLKTYKEVMDLLQPLLSATATLNLIVYEELLNVIVKHINRSSTLMCKFWYETLMRFQT